MSIIRITPDNIERYTLLANPRRTFSSSSQAVSHVVPAGITGTLPLFSDGSSLMKDVYTDTGLNSKPADDEQIEILRQKAYQANLSDAEFNTCIFSYMSGVNALTSSTQYDKKQSVLRFEPGARLNPDFQRKRVIKDMVMPFYRSYYSSLQYSYTNYHTLNFVTCSYLSPSSSLIYPAGTGSVALENVNFYAPSGSFTFDFYINPRYTTENAGEEYKPGTILHMSSSYAISLVSGTSVGVDGKPNAYRLLLQLSQSSEIPPSSVNISGDTVTAPHATADPGFLFVSPDNSLKKNHWHHVAIRWGGANTSNGAGSFVIDGTERSIFVITSGSVMEPINRKSDKDHHDADALFVGNFYEGSNYNEDPIAGFFNATDAAEYGTIVFSTNVERDPRDATFRHPLNAEIHDIKIFNRYRSLSQIVTSSTGGFEFDPYFVRPLVSGSDKLKSGSSANDGLLFYVPPLFTKESPKRHVNQTPFFYATGTSEDPFNVAMSFGVGGHELNLQNFTREFVRGFYPRPLGLEAARVSDTTSVAHTANYFIYESGSNRKRNITVLPNDNGKFFSNYQMLLTGSLTKPTSGSELDRFRNDFGGLDLSRIDLSEMVSTASLPKFDDPNDTVTIGAGAMLAPLLGATPEDPAIAPGNILTILQRTKDPSSNEVVFFDISNMFYGDMIKPKSVVLKDLAVTGTNGRVQITLKDDGYGNLYRADALTAHSTWNSVGNVIYEEGILFVKSPNIPLFGADAWEISFEGQRNIHVLEVNVPVEKGLINSSTNPSYQDLIPSDYASETASSFVYLTGLQLHDENLNVVARANLAQPVIKRDGDRYTIRIRMDY